MLHKAMQNEGSRVAIAVLATFLYAVGVNLFIVPVGLYSGGVVGLSQVLRTVLAQRAALPAGVDVAGILYFLLNVPMLFLGWRELGRGFLVRTLICVGASSLFLSVIPAPASPILDERLAACVVGGILCGFALGLALTCGCSTGGLDIIGLCLSKRGSRFTVGRFSMSFNVLLYAACALLFDIQTAIYSVIYTVFCSLFIDRGHQQNISVQVLIFTRDEDPALPQSIMSRLGRGVTPSRQSDFCESPAARPFSFFRVRATVRCARRRDNPRAAAGRRECRIRMFRAAAPRRRNRTSALPALCAGPCA